MMFAPCDNAPPRPQWPPPPPMPGHWTQTSLTLSPVCLSPLTITLHYNTWDPNLFVCPPLWLVNALLTLQHSSVIGPRLFPRFHRVGLCPRCQVARAGQPGPRVREHKLQTQRGVGNNLPFKQHSVQWWGSQEKSREISILSFIFLSFHHLFHLLDPRTIMASILFTNMITLQSLWCQLLFLSHTNFFLDSPLLQMW